MANFVSFVILILLLYGRSLHNKDRQRHVRWMVGVILADVTLIAYLVIARRALSKINSTMGPELMIHIGFALGTVVLYLLAAKVGWDLLKGKPVRHLMRILDRLIIPFRVLTLLTSLWVQFSK